MTGTRNITTKPALIKRLSELARSTKGWEEGGGTESPESAHAKADSALLEYIGDDDVKKAFESIDKWYA